MVTPSLTEQARAKAETEDAFAALACAMTKEQQATAEAQVIAAVRADILSLIEQEARRRCLTVISPGNEDTDEPAVVEIDQALRSLADFCRQQREGS